ncbi:uncharacterized protein LODBEIA_P13520 [Lodderomyces beijingensis]|uniref:2,5-diamino-6-ribosylamino-4(3H)-pyrimidinone 5'-phosphate reductase n=1 Tax=Lodderomyces beijingensis TaxID=1775926 RepID=A0ABP0ZHM1_9ASCO
MPLDPLPESLLPFLSPYLPSDHPDRPFVTLTYAQSLDARIAAEPGVQTKLSHSETKTMTHYLRSKHDAILVGVGTALADDPKLNCRFPGSTTTTARIRPVIVDPRRRWKYAGSTLRKLVESGDALAPIVVVDASTSVGTHGGDEDVRLIREGGGELLAARILDDHGSRRDNSWEVILALLHAYGIKSVMVEGGAMVINELLCSSSAIVDSLIVTVAPVFLGQRGVLVSPREQVELRNVDWWKGIVDSVMCARIK